MRSRRISKRTAVLVAVWAAFCGWIAWGWWSVNGVQEPPYSVLRVGDGYEVRQYGSLLAAQVSVAGPWDTSYQEGFSLLTAYLDGQNTTAESVARGRPIGMEPEHEDIAPAVPVLQQEKNGVWLVSFVLPPQWTDVTVPRPDDPRVRIVRLPARTVAIARHSGPLTRAEAATYERQLRESLVRDKAVVLGAPALMQYHGPWVPSFLRRNEIIIPIR